jgi:Predicted RNA-binding protein homologous to eukaryotic snRNP
MDAERGQEAGSLAMFLRKKFSDKKIKNIYQINFDRVVRIDMYNGSSIVMELFRDGNLITLTDDIIDYAFYPREWKNRKIVKGEIYKPPSSTDPLNMSVENRTKIFQDSKASAVQTMATRLNFGGELSEEILFRNNLDKDRKSAECIDSLDVIVRGLDQCLQETRENKGYYYESQDIGSPIRLNFISPEPSKTYDDFNELLMEMMEKDHVENPENLKMKRIQESQEKTIKEYQRLADRDKELGNFISANFQKIAKILNILSRSDTETIKLEELECTVVKKDKAKKIVTLNFGNYELSLNYTKTVGENMAAYFNTSKDYLERIVGAEEALKQTMAGYTITQERKKKERPRMWFENYHWFYTTNNHLVIGGKNTDTNEKVVKKHMGEKDIYIHADMYGAPSTVIRNEDGAEITEQEITEAAAFAVSFSRAWQNGLSSGTAYWVTPLQVSKTPESGQYVRKGSWIVRGKRTYMFNLPLRLKVSIREIKGMRIPMIFPTIGEEKDETVIIPGSRKREKVAKEIAQKLHIDAEEILRIMPAGNVDTI